MEKLTIIVGVNEKKGSKVLNNFRENWRTIYATEEQVAEDPNLAETFDGIHPELTAIPVQEIRTNKNEYIFVINDIGNTPLFQLQGDKALQLGVLEDFLRGEIKRQKGVKWL